MRQPSSERAFLRAVCQLGYSNPFTPERVELERAALGRDFVEDEPVWSIRVEDPDTPRASVWNSRYPPPPARPRTTGLMARWSRGAAGVQWCQVSGTSVEELHTSVSHWK